MPLILLLVAWLLLIAYGCCLAIVGGYHALLKVWG